MDEVDIVLSHVSKKYCKSLKRSMSYGISDISRNICGLSSRSHRLRDGEFWALNDVSFQVKRGEALGLIGPNGSGKSTVLKLLNGIMWPDIGKIGVKGKVGALIEVGAGFHPMLTGRENIYLNAAILGMTNAEVKEKFEDIVEFAEIGDFLDTPVKFYSSGMFVKLGFAVAVNCDPDVLLVDEVLAVGDIAFRRKCFKRLKELREANITLILVSHDLVTIKHHAERAVFLNHGEVAYIGSPEEAISEYLHSLSAKKMAQKGALIPSRDSPASLDEAELELDHVALLDKNLAEKDVFATGEPFVVRIDFNAKKRIEDPTVGIAFYNSEGEVCSGSNTRLDGYKIDTLQGRGSIVFKTNSLPLYPGIYRLELGFRDKNLGPIADITDAALVRVRGGSTYGSGMFYMPHSWDLEM